MQNRPRLTGRREVSYETLGLPGLGVKLKETLLIGTATDEQHFRASLHRQLRVRVYPHRAIDAESNYGTPVSRRICASAMVLSDSNSATLTLKTTNPSAIINVSPCRKKCRTVSA